ncbi:MAG: aminoacyl-histidine dipeptidase [Deltaproteobacteria bacterium]|nr:aminoacyl-histidine dipeptidase [Deltaproteobacteria bacterium]
MTSAFPEGLEPSLLWKNFNILTSTPRCSGEEESVLRKIETWADGLGFARERDETGNLLVRVPGTPGREERGVTVIQGHVDMVCEKNAEVDFDFGCQGINVVLEGDWVTGVGTTLGADNGIGVAAGMAVAEDPEAVHGPLELLFTIDEETGMTGAWGLKPGFLTGTRMLNLDTEEQGAIYVGCSGGGDVMSRFSPDLTAPIGDVALRMTVKGLVGGHSGLDIHENRANAIKLVGRALARLQAAGVSLQLADLAGGSKRNAVPREASATLILAREQVPVVRGLIERLLPELHAEFQPTDPGLTVVTEEVAVPAQAWSQSFSARLVAVILANPSGVASMSRDVPGLVETSNNLGVVRMTDGAVELVNCTRSTVGSALESLRASITALHALAGGSVELDEAYPGWQPDLNSGLLKVAQGVHQELFGAEAEIKAVHAGLECGLLGQHYPGLEMISIGPDIRGAHSPDERLSVPSSQDFYVFVKGILAALD